MEFIENLALKCRGKTSEKYLQPSVDKIIEGEETVLGSWESSVETTNNLAFDSKLEEFEKNVEAKVRKKFSEVMPTEFVNKVMPKARGIFDELKTEYSKYGPQNIDLEKLEKTIKELTDNTNFFENCALDSIATNTRGLSMTSVYDNIEFMSESAYQEMKTRPFTPESVEKAFLSNMKHVEARIAGHEQVIEDLMKMINNSENDKKNVDLLRIQVLKNRKALKDQHDKTQGKYVPTKESLTQEKQLEGQISKISNVIKELKKELSYETSSNLSSKKNLEEIQEIVDYFEKEIEN